jgi:hypothetical protein
LFLQNHLNSLNETPTTKSDRVVIPSTWRPKTKQCCSSLGTKFPAFSERIPF